LVHWCDAAFGADDAADNRTSSTQDADSGRLKTITKPLLNVTRYAYRDRGDTTNIWSSAATPVEYTLDDFGQRETMNTFRGGSNWNSTSWPSASTGTADTTTWVYEDATVIIGDT